ncbi:MAG: LysR family transcriptional activator of nhaA [Myxococcota bacterium]|jgi:LysR family transcriptional activator of nhaA
MPNHLNYQHLRYFWMTAREGSLTRASKRLKLAPSTVSAQIRLLEEALDRKLFERKRRTLVLTEHGQVVKEYADDIFALGEEMLEVTRSETNPRHAYQMRVGVSNNLPKLVAWRLLHPVLHLENFPVHLVCVEDHAERLVADLAVHHLDLVLADTPVGLVSDVDSESRLLGECGVTLMAAPQVAAHYLLDFPNSLSNAPMLLPDTGSGMRRLLEEFFSSREMRPRIVAEFGDSALMKAFGQEGAGVFPVPSMVCDQVASQYRVVRLGELEGLRERFYAVTLKSRLENPAVKAIFKSAGDLLDHPFGFGESG